MAQAEHCDVVFRAQQIDVVGLVRRTKLTVAKDLDVVVLIHDRHLDHGEAVRRLAGVRVLIPFSAFIVVASGHPLAGLQFPQHDAVELIAALDRERTTAALGEIRGREPGDQRLVRACSTGRG